MKRYFLIPVVIILIFFLVLFVEVMLARKGPREDFQNPSNEPLIIGEGDSELTYIVLLQGKAVLMKMELLFLVRNIYLK